MRYPTQYRPMKFLTFPATITLQWLQIELLHPGVEEAVGSHEVDLTSPISSRTMSCPKRSPAQDIRIVSQLRFYAQVQIDIFILRLPCCIPFPGHAYSQTRTYVFTNADMRVRSYGYACPFRRAHSAAADSRRGRNCGGGSGGGFATLKSSHARAAGRRVQSGETSSSEPAGSFSRSGNHG